MVNFEVLEDIATLSSGGAYCKRLTLTAWGDNPPKLDLRAWRISDSGDYLPGKGTTLDKAEAAKLRAALDKMDIGG